MVIPLRKHAVLEQEPNLAMGLRDVGREMFRER